MKIQVPELGPLPVPLPVGRFERPPTGVEASVFDSAPADQVPELEGALLPTFDEDLGPFYDQMLRWSEKYLSYFPSPG